MTAEDVDDDNDDSPTRVGGLKDDADEGGALDPPLAKEHPDAIAAKSGTNYSRPSL